MDGSSIQQHYKYFSTLLFLIVTFLASVSNALAFSYGYETIQLTNNDYPDRGAQINNSGYVVWRGQPLGDNTDSEIFLYNGTTTTQLIENDYYERHSDINNDGHIVWISGSAPAVMLPIYPGTPFDDEVFLYNGATITRLTNNNYLERASQINDNGHVVWEGDDGTDWEIFLYDGTTITSLSNNSNHDDRYPRINKNGYVVWQGCEGYWDDCSDWEIFLYDGMTVTQLTDNDYSDLSPQINDNGLVVWSGYDGSDYEVFLYDGMSTIQLTNNNYSDGQYSRINNNGQVAWIGMSDSEGEVFLYNGTTIIQLTDNDYREAGVQISDSGYVVWSGYDGSDYEIFLYDGTTTTQLTNNDYNDRNPQIKNRSVVWEGWDGSDYEIFLSRPRLGVVVAPALADYWWRSEDYWGFWDPRIPWPPPVPPPYDAEPPGVDIPEPGPLPYPCVECPFSRSWQARNMPAVLPYIYRYAHVVFANPRQPKSLVKSKERLVAHLKTVPAGQRYDESMKTSIIKSISVSKFTRKDAPSILGELLQVVNAIELDWRVPPLTPQTVKTGKEPVANFSGVAWVKFSDLKKPGKLSLNVDGNLPALVSGARPVWPVAGYHFDFTGEPGDHIDISIYFGGQGFRGGLASLHLLEWDGKSYRDITTAIDWPRKVITGRTNRLATYFIASPDYAMMLDEGKTKGVGLH